MADWTHDQSCSEVCVSRALEGRSWQEAELDAPRVVQLYTRVVPLSPTLNIDLRLNLLGATPTACVFLSALGCRSPGLSGGPQVKGSSRPCLSHVCAVAAASAWPAFQATEPALGTLLGGDDPWSHHDVSVGAITGSSAHKAQDRTHGLRAARHRHTPCRQSSIVTNATHEGGYSRDLRTDDLVNVLVLNS